MSSLMRAKYLIFSPWEASGKGPCNKYHAGQFHHRARLLMASFALTGTVQTPGLCRVSAVCLPRASDPWGQGQAGEEGPPGCQLLLGCLEN